jgi:hypothetical protein
MAGAEIEAAFLALEQDAMGSAGLPMAGATLTRSADMRYLGQGFEIEVALPAGPYDDTEGLLAAFRAAYARIFSRTIDWAAAELVALRVVASLPLVDAQAPLLLDEAVPRIGETTRDIVLGDGRVARARALGWGPRCSRKRARHSSSVRAMLPRRRRWAWHAWRWRRRRMRATLSTPSAPRCSGGA